MVCEPGRQPVGTGYTRFGQWVIVVGDKSAPKVAAGKHQTYAEYRAQVEAEGRIHGTGPTRTYTNIHHSRVHRHGEVNPGEGDVFGNKRGPANTRGQI